MKAFPNLVLLTCFVVAPSLRSQELSPPALPTGTMRSLIENYSEDKALLERRYRAPLSLRRAARMKGFFAEVTSRLEALDFSALDRDGQVDWLLLRNELRRQSKRLARTVDRDDAVRGLLPFSTGIVALAEDRASVRPIEPRRIAERIDQITTETKAAFGELAAATLDWQSAKRSADAVGALKRALSEWFRFYDGYDPDFSWWVKAPYTALRSELDDGEQALRKRTALGDGDAFRGEPIGRAALLEELELAMVPYSPEELISIARREFAWCDKEMLRAAKDLGHGEDWKSALAAVKNLHVDPGAQPAMIRELALEATAFVETRNLVSVPALCKEGWRMTMLSPARQKISPYFLGGETIQVSFPTDAMAHIDKLMSMRGNNRHFSRATVHHELIPGHHLQGYMTKRHRPYRALFNTPFWVEGWALYWEMLLWDLDFPQCAEDRVGMLFWRMHRCARIVFSLSYHLGSMSEEQCVDFLVDRVGHERNNAAAEVRRSVIGGYGPLYQAAYMLGALQIRALRREVVDSGAMPERSFHDSILKLGSIPIEMLRASLTDMELQPDFEASWRFYGEVDVDGR